MSKLAKARVALGVTAGIAAYKAAELVRLLVKQGAEVQVILTAGAEAFITPLTLQTLSKNRVHDSLLDVEAEAAMSHIELARWGDLVLIAPATADFIARLAHGFANDLLTTVCLATTTKLVVAPAMNSQMWHNAATQSNIKQLQQRQIAIIGPGKGEQACGEHGLGRLTEPSDIIGELETIHGK